MTLFKYNKHTIIGQIENQLLPDFLGNGITVPLNYRIRNPIDRNDWTNSKNDAKSEPGTNETRSINPKPGSASRLNFLLHNATSSTNIELVTGTRHSPLAR